ncbi:MAG: SurA N-terminal domain-containing protein [Deltaproteobacteria bacterium]|nr:SurA N-terminal domain-containing protein [Deltaproteobacteria bacterium]
MLESLRKRKSSVVILLVFAAIVIVFIFWGAGPSKYGEKDGAAVAAVDGETISAKDFTAIYRRQTDYYKGMFGGKLSDETMEKMQLKQKSLDILINRILAKNDAKSKGMAASVAEVQDTIKAIPAFSKAGVFDIEVYKKVLAANRYKERDFEKSIEEDMLVEKARVAAVGVVTVTDDEARKAYQRENKKINLDYVAVDAGRFVDMVKVTDDEAAEYLKKNGSMFMTPVKVNAFYAFVDFKEAAKAVLVSAEEIKEYYEKNPKEFETPEEIKARHILIPPDPKEKDGAKAKEDARKKAEEIIKELKKAAGRGIPSRFAQLAKKYSMDPGSKEKGGDLGWVKRGMMVKPFEDGLFALKKGEISAAVESGYGFHIILAEERRGGGKTSLKDAEGALRKTLLVQKSWVEAKDIIIALDKPFKDAKNVEELKKAAAGRKYVKVFSTGLFSEADNLTEFARQDVLRDAAFALREGEVSRPLQTHEGFYLIKIVERVDARVPEYKLISEIVKKKLRLEKAEEEAKNAAAAFLKKVKGGEDFFALAKKEKFKVAETGPFSKKDGTIKKLNVFAGGDDRFFNLDKSAPYFPDPLQSGGRHFVFRLKEIKDADTKGFDKDKDELKKRLQAQKEEEGVNKWLKDLREKAKIKVYQENMP